MYALRRILLLSAAGLALGPAARSVAQQDVQDLRPELERRIAQHRGTVGLALIDLGTGQTLGIEADLPFPSASIIKIPILIELFHQVEHGRIRLDDPIFMLEVDKQPGSGVIRFLQAPHRLTVRDAAFLMIALSDNTATNLVIDKVGIRPVNDRMDSLGLPRTTLHSKTFLRATSIAVDSSVVYGLGVTTPMEIARLLAMIHRGEAVSPAASDTMRAFLREQFYNYGLPRYLPAGVVGHKTGDLSESRHDCGIIDTERRDYVLCIMTKENQDRSWRVDNEAVVLIADLARIVHTRLADSTP